MKLGTRILDGLCLIELVLHWGKIHASAEFLVWCGWMNPNNCLANFYLRTRKREFGLMLLPIHMTQFFGWSLDALSHYRERSRRPDSGKRRAVFGIGLAEFYADYFVEPDNQRHENQTDHA